MHKKYKVHCIQGQTIFNFGDDKYNVTKIGGMNVDLLLL